MSQREALSGAQAEAVVREEWQPRERRSPTMQNRNSRQHRPMRTQGRPESLNATCMQKEVRKMEEEILQL